MGEWAGLFPADTETWMTLHTSRYFLKKFGIAKNVLDICTLEPEVKESNYIPAPYFKKLFARLDALTRKDHKALERRLVKFYSFKDKAKIAIKHNSQIDFSRISIKELIGRYRTNRDWIHRAAVYDQLAWMGEEYWARAMDRILSKSLSLRKDSPEYKEILFALTKPREISTTLLEKKAVLTQALRVKKGRKVLAEAAQELSDEFGWLPVFTYGTPWGRPYYRKELAQAMKKDETTLRRDYAALKNYRLLRDAALKKLVDRYKIGRKDLQVFLDYGLALDTRNEAEYLVSYGGFYLLPIYQEISRRLKLSINQVRTLFEEEIVACLRGRADAQELIKEKEGLVAWGFNRAMTKRVNFSAAEARELLAHLEKPAKVGARAAAKSGLTASLGQATGPARIVKSPADNHKVKPGDILITYATTVDYLPAMKRAAAIITEVGGLTCHAAVVAREFGIPCIVALRGAMVDFKDGQLIEVDADRGQVKIIKNH